jgi:hypothetical protein
MLKKMRDWDGVQLVWEPEGGREFGILPIGSRINFMEPRKVSRKIVSGLIDGLQ